jgi:hypothetical protein
MRLSSEEIADALAWSVLAGLFIVAGMVASRLGFVGLALIGFLTWLICTRPSLDKKVSTWTVGRFRAAAERPRSSEEQAVVYAENQVVISLFRFYGWCGVFLAAIGATGLIWHAWMG